MIDFQTLKSLIINGQSVIQLTIDGRTVWEAHEPQPSNAYIETDGVASYMDLNFIPTADCSLEVCATAYAVGQYNIVMSAGANRSSRFTYRYNTLSQSIEVFPSVTALAPYPEPAKGVYRYSKGKAAYDDNEVDYTFAESLWSMKFGWMMGTTYFSHVRFYYAKFWENGVLIRDLVPYSGPRGVGLLDRVNDVLYTNANTTGTLTYGIEEPWGGLKFKSTQDGSTVKMVKVGSSAPDVSLEYSIDKGKTWQDFIVFSSSTSSDGTLVTLNAGNELWLRANNPNSTFSEAATYYNSCVMTGAIGESGNIMSLLDKDTFETDTSLAGKTRCFSTLFQKCTSLTSSPELPATTLVDYCYQYMFQNCTSLASTPGLPATTLGSNCYYGMFQNCTSLTKTPELPATTMAQNCYRSMFSGCTSLEQASELPATTLAQYCYGYMFRACTSLVQAPELLATTVNNSCYGYMFQNCTSLKRIKMNASSGTWGPGMFEGCSSLELVDMTGSIGVPQLGNVNNFANTNDTYKIVVPDALYEDWIAATNWSDASIKPHIMKQSDWNSAHPDDLLG